MGAETVKDLVKFSNFKMIVIADKNVDAAKRLCARLGDPRVSVQEVDASSHEDLIRVFSGKTVIAGALGPFYRFERPVIEAAIDARVNYVSICDDHDAIEAALELDDAAAAKGLKILSGLGWTPGLSNMLARQGYDEIDNVHTIRIYWGSSAGDSEGMAVILHTLHIFTGMVTSFRDWRHVSIKAGSGKEAVQFPQPLGEIKTFHLGHPEPVTLPRYLKGVREVTLKGGLAENYLNSLARLVSAAGLTSSARKKEVLAKILKTLLPFFPSNKERHFSGIRVDVSGTQNGLPVTVSYAAVDNMKRLTAIPLSIGAMMMAQGKIERTGVFGPEAEGALPPKLFSEELARRQIKLSKRELK